MRKLLIIICLLLASCGEETALEDEIGYLWAEVEDLKAQREELWDLEIRIDELSGRQRDTWDLINQEIEILLARIEELSYGDGFPPANGELPIDGTAMADLWYPGGIDSFWLYEIPPDYHIDVEVTDERTLDGRTYKVVQESIPIMSMEIDPEPFLTFRIEGSQVLGCGSAANEMIKDTMAESFAQFGLPRNLLEIC